MKQQSKIFIKNIIKFFFITFIILLAITFRGSLTNIVTPEKPVNQTLEIALFTKADYSPDIYKNSSAIVEVTISKYRDKKFHVIYNTVLEAASLRKLPSQQEAFIKAIQVNNFYEKKELLVATYTVSYESNGSVLKYDKHILIPESNGKRELTITI